MSLLLFLAGIATGALWTWAHMRQRVLHAERLAEAHRQERVYWHTAYSQMAHVSRLVALRGGKEEP